MARGTFPNLIVNRGEPQATPLADHHPIAAMKPFTCCTLLLMALPALSGCSALDLDMDLPFSFSRDSKAQIADIVCLWEPAEGVGLDGLPTRGFAGQILFFRSGKPEPIRVDGDVWIYVFDDQGTSEEQARPMHQFEFPAAVWNTYLQKTNLGSAYQLFIPYTRKGVNLANCALRVRLTSEGHMPAYSKLANVTLGGKPSHPAIADDELPPIAELTPAARPQTAAVELDAIQKLSAELGTGNQFTQLERLRTAARGGVHTADYVEDVPKSRTPVTADESDELRDFRRYRMSAGGKSE